MNPNMLRLAPLVALLLMCLALALGLFKRDGHSDRASNLIGHRIEPFNLTTLNGTGHLTPKAWRGQVVVLNVFASWCELCAVEHPSLMRLAQSGKVTLYGLAWKDKPAALIEWLNTHGDPYEKIGLDSLGTTTLPLALTGVPETFIINKNGDIVYQYKSPLTDEMVDTVIIPLVEKLNSGDVQ